MEFPFKKLNVIDIEKEINTIYNNFSSCTLLFMYESVEKKTTLTSFRKTKNLLSSHNSYIDY